MIDQAIIERAGAALDELFAAVAREHPGRELLIRSNPDGDVFIFDGDDAVAIGSRCTVFVNLCGFKGVKAYAGSTAEAVASVLGRATETEGQS